MSRGRISFAYSPDTDDTFMALALREGHIDTRGFDFDFLQDDIQVLNEAARQGQHDITAISIAAYPALADSYALMPIGASIGDEFGPAVVVPEASGLRRAEQVAGKRVAIPGRQTSAYFAACDLFGDFEAVPLPFHDIGPAVLAGDVDAGILIHELQLNYAEFGLRKIGDLGQLWFQRHAQPLPLGANAIRRSLGPDAIRDLTAILTESIEWGLANREETLKKSVKIATAELPPELGERYISMYVNHRTLAIQEDVRAGIATLLQAGASHGLCPAVNLNEAFSPS